MRNQTVPAPRAESSEDIGQRIATLTAELDVVQKLKAAAAAQEDRAAFERAHRRCDDITRDIEWGRLQQAAARAREKAERDETEKERQSLLRLSRNDARVAMIERAKRIQTLLAEAAGSFAELQTESRRFVEHLGGDSSVVSILIGRTGPHGPLGAAIWASGLAEHIDLPRVSAVHWTPLDATVGGVLGPQE